MRESKLRFFSVGRSAVNKKPSSKELEVWPSEMLPFSSGELTDHATLYETQGVDSRGKSFTSSIQTTSTVKATWMGIGESNRLTAPDVMRGEKVVLYQFADEDAYYWDTYLTKEERTARTLETAIFAFKATPDHGVEESPDTSYFLEVSAHKKHLVLKTSAMNGEVTRYEITINPGEGYLTISDDRDNHIQINSLQNIVHLETGDGAIFEGNKKDVNIICDRFSVQAMGQVSIESPVTNIKSNVNTIGTLTNNGVDVGSEHTHAGVKAGPDTSDAPVD